jgi:hypothetical protein
MIAEASGKAVAKNAFTRRPGSSPASGRAPARIFRNLLLVILAPTLFESITRHGIAQHGLAGGRKAAASSLRDALLKKAAAAAAGGLGK